MGALLQFLTNGPAAGTTATTANTGASSLVSTGGAETWVSDSTTGRTKVAMQTITAGTAIDLRFYLDSASSQLAMTSKFTTPAAAPSGESQLLSARWGTSSGGRCWSLVWETNGQLRFLDSVNTLTNIGSAGLLSLGTEYVFAVVAAGGGAGAGNGTATIHVYAIGNSTPLATASVSGANFTTNQFGSFSVGAGTVVGTIAVMDLQLQGGTSTEIADYVATTPLSAPTVTLGTTTNPSTVGGSNGSQVVSWAGVANATSYDSYIATNTSPVQGDFTLVASGVSSPYTFTGLTAGGYAFGIKAKP